MPLIPWKTPAMNPKIKSLAPWYGAKRKKVISDKIIFLLGKPKLFVEPFCGSCAVSLSIPFQPSTHIVNDLHSDLINVARCLAEQGELLVEKVSNMLFCEDLFLFNVNKLNTQHFIMPDLDRAAAYLYVSWCGVNGFAGTVQEIQKPRFAKRYSASGGDGAKRWISVMDSMPLWQQKMRRWTILNDDAFTVLKKIKDDESTSVYVDSPYHQQARSQAKYVHDFTQEQHEELEESLRRFNKARLVISHYDCEAIRDLYTPEKGWLIDECSMTKNIANATGKTSEAPELLITRGIK